MESHTNADLGGIYLNTKIMFIICYYGSFPEWMDLWLLSCQHNPNFNFTIVTDLPLQHLPDNVHILPLTMNELRQRFTHILGFEAALSNPYKLCDYKPLYGLAFQKELAGYDFWGHCDIDLIWGDLGKFITDELLGQFDRIGKYGHLTLYRNSEKINRLFMLSGSAFPYDVVFKDEHHYGFDEITGLNLICDKNGVPYYQGLQIADANWLLSRVSAHAANTTAEVYFWRDGKVYRAYQWGDNEYRLTEYAYLHFQKKHPRYDPEQNYENGFLIQSTKFKPFSEPIFLNLIQSESEFYSNLHDRMDLIHGQRKRIKNILFTKSWHEKKILLKKAIALL